LKQSQDQYEPSSGFDLVGTRSLAPIAESGPSSSPPDLRQPQGDRSDSQFLPLCQLPNGEIVSYQDMGNGFGLVAGGVNGGLGLGIGRAATDMQMPTESKPGGLAGGGRSGKVTSPASRVLRQVTGYARYAPSRRLSGTASVGGSMAKALPFWGSIPSFLDYIEMQNAPTCTPVA
jgi:hypothetical protein